MPGHTTVSVFARGEHNGDAVGPAGQAGATRVRVYTARLDSRAGPLHIGVGRLTSPHDPFGGSWDGLAIHVGEQMSIAAEAGWEPDRGTGAPSSRLPRVSLSVLALRGTGTVRYRGSVSVLRYLNDAPLGRSRLALSTRHSLRAGPLGLRADFIAESDSGAFAVRSGSVLAALTAANGAWFHAGYRRYEPWGFLTPDTLADLSDRSRLEAGGHVPFGRASLSVNAVTTGGASSRRFGVNSQVYVRALAGGLDFDVSGGIWRSGDSGTLAGGAGVTRDAGRLHTRAAYRIERGPETDPVLSHEFDGMATVMVGRRSSISVLAAHSTAGASNGTQLQLLMAWGF
jgi:hypothetical protein